jgi:sulfide:quinone oxidoreductase
MSSAPDGFRVVIAGGSVGALEALMALRELAGDRVTISMIADRDEFVYRPLAVREPFAYPAAKRYPLAPIASEFDATLVRDRLAWVDPDAREAHTDGGETLAYDALLVAIGTRLSPRFEHALTIDDRGLDRTLHGLIQDIEDGYAKRIAYVAGPRMAWPLPIYELALLTARRAYSMSAQCEVHVITPEEAPLAIFGATASDGVARLLENAGIVVHTRAHPEVPTSRSVVVRPGEEPLAVDRVVALPELVGPGIRGLPLDEHGFLAVDQHSRVIGVDRVYAAGDVTDFPLKFGGIAAQQGDAAAESIAELAGAEVEPTAMHPTIHGILLTGEAPRYLTAQVTGGEGFQSQFSEAAPGEPLMKIHAVRLGPYLERLDA